jgi:hypothetical protein
MSPFDDGSDKPFTFHARAGGGHSGLLREIAAPARANHFAGENCLSRS